MLVIRFIRTGKRNQPFFRIVVTDKKNPPQGGRFLEILGFFNPLTKERKLKAERIKYWLSVGAQPSKSLHNLLVSEGIIKAKKIDVHKKPKKKEKEKEEVKEEEVKKEESRAEQRPKEEKPKETPQEKPKTQEEKPKEGISPNQPEAKREKEERKEKEEEEKKQK